MKSTNLPFLWDYDLHENEVRKILAGPEGYEKDWMITRILEHAPWKMIWTYLDINIIQEHIAHLRLKPTLKNLWEYALKRWTPNTNPTS